MSDRKFILIGLIFIVLGIILGAMGAHYLETIGIDKEKIDSFATGTSYLLYNGIASLAVAGIAHKFDFELRMQFGAILWGTVMFSGSIFALVLLPTAGIEMNKFIGPITPIGGLLLIFGWLTLLIKYIRTYKS
ncbi:DUF423 domain-containing protein [Brumimicrobium aurantiacum]|uniref:DUF423 domain-containing protein n=1 Tax=Brumimicrobium aurantiacum TaxID=1737063 RepID=A0A3E1EZA5_9FLAO|nr:DUF423 domain-containing protein [Brumimicrobium aurantiacum]RFC54900.1 DUF423 domain-containing protein [Brumimicrobium aurantiacum]